MNADSSRALERIRSATVGSITAAEYLALARALPDRAETLRPVRVVLLSTFTTSFLDAFLRVEGARLGLGVETWHGGFGQFEQVLLGDDWRARDGIPEALVIVIRPEDLDPDLPYRTGTGERSLATLGADILGRVDSLLSVFRQKSNGPALVANFALPRERPQSVFDANSPDSLTHGIHDLNRSLSRVLSGRAGVYVWDYAGLVAACGSRGWTDPRFWALARTAVAPAHQAAFAAHLARTLRAVLMPAAKCLVLDLDNTLWGGVVGDDGPGGLQLGDDYPGNTYKWFQRAVLGLRDRGILLAVCSKNDAEVVHDVLDSHPEMLLRRGDFAAERVNWRPKSENLREIAEELNIGVDSLVLFDDNPVERAEVRSRLPEVRVVEVPSDPALYVQALADIVEFDMPTVTPEDRSRAESYRAERERRQSETSATSLEDFLASLDMSVEIGPVNPGTLQRVAQLVAKTNQYNLTTRRHSEAELDGMARRDGGGVYWVRLKDRYGDMGLIAVGILLPAGADALVDSLVLSCRAANRGIEQALLAFLARTARALGYTGLVAEYLATARNHVVADLYPRLGFEPLAVKPDVARYRLDLATGSIEFPPYLTVRDGA